MQVRGGIVADLGIDRGVVAALKLVADLLQGVLGALVPYFRVKADGEQRRRIRVMLVGVVKFNGGDTLDVLKPGLDVQRSIVGDVGHHDVGCAVGDEVVIHHGQALAGLGGVGQVGRDVVLDLDPARGDGTENQRKYV